MKRVAACCWDWWRIRVAIVQAHGETRGSRDCVIVEDVVGVEGSRDGNLRVDELIDEARVELNVRIYKYRRHHVSVVSCVVSLLSLSSLTLRFIGEDRLGCHNGGSTFSDTIPNLTSSRIRLVGLRPRSRSVVCALSFVVSDLKSSIIVKNPSFTSSARRLPTTKS